MEDRKEGGAWLSVPAFGDWDQKHGGVPDYSMDFSKIREMRKQNKQDLSRLSVGNDDDDLVNPTAPKATAAAADHHHHHHHHHIVGGDRAAGGDEARPHHSGSSPTTKGKIMRYLNCCVSA